MRKKGICIALGLAASVAGAMDMDTFLRRVQDKHLTRVEDAIGELPEEYFDYYTLMRESRSSQPATDEAPRAILFGRQASFIVAFNGDPSLPNYDTLEMIQVRDGGARFEFRQLRFPTAANRLTEAKPSDPNPRACLSCHEQNPRPNWDPYSRWPGAYGEDGDLMQDVESAKYAAYLAAKNPRYERLLRSGASPVSPYRNRLPEREMGPNIYFTKLLARWNANRVVATLLAPLEGRDRLAVPALFFGCESLPPAAWERMGRVFGLGDGETTHRYLVANGRREIENQLRRRGVTPADWSLAFVPHDAPRPTRYYYFDGVFELRMLANYALLERLKTEYPVLEPVSGQFAYDFNSGSDGRARGRAMIEAVNALGGVPDASAGQICRVLGPELAKP